MLKANFKAKVYYGWTFPCWVDSDLEQTIGNTYRTKSDLLEGRIWVGTFCNCASKHKPIRIKVTISGKVKPCHR